MSKGTGYRPYNLLCLTHIASSNSLGYFLLSSASISQSYSSSTPHSAMLHLNTLYIGYSQHPLIFSSLSPLLMLIFLHMVHFPTCSLPITFPSCLISNYLSPLLCLSQFLENPSRNPSLPSYSFLKYSKTTVG